MSAWPMGVAAGGLNRTAPAEIDAFERRVRERIEFVDQSLRGLVSERDPVQFLLDFTASSPDARLAARACVRERADAEGLGIGPGPRRLLDNLLAIIVGAGRPLRTCDLALRADARVRRVSMALSKLRRRGLVYGSELATLHTTRRTGGPRGLRHITWAETPLGFATAVARARGIDHGQLFGAEVEP